MHVSAPFIRRPVATFLLSIAVILSGTLAYKLLPVAPLPQVDSPTINVSAGLPGADPVTVASAIAKPLERAFGRIAGVTEMTSVSGLGNCSISLQFDLSRDVNGAARDVQAAINAARSQLPANLPSVPTYRKINPSDSPVLILALTSQTLPMPQLYDAADSVLGQKISQIAGVGQVFIGGSAKPAVRVEANPMQLNAYGVGLDTLRTILGQANVNRPKGFLSNDATRMTVSTSDQLSGAAQYAPLIISYKNGAPVRIRDVAKVVDSVEDIHTGGMENGRPAIQISIFKTADANVIETVDNVQKLLPQLRASISPAIDLQVAIDRTVLIRKSVEEVTRTLVISIALVVLVVFVFLHEGRSTLIPSVSVPLSLLGTFGVMYMLGYTLDNLSLMALTISTGFVVDDAIVVIENINRYLESGMSPFKAAMVGSREIGFTVLSMSTSLIAVFIPILLMAGIVGRLFREFAVTLSVAIMVSLVVSLVTTPMLCAKFLEPRDKNKHGRIYRMGERAQKWMLSEYARGLRWVLRHQKIVLAVFLLTFGLNFYLYYLVPKGFFPEQDVGRLNGNIKGQQDISFDSMRQKMIAYSAIIIKDPAVETVLPSLGGGPGGGSSNSASITVGLKPIDERKGVSAFDVVTRLRPQLARIPGATIVLQVPQEVGRGARAAAAEYQYSLSDENLTELNTWAPRLMARMQQLPQLRDVTSDQQDRGLREQLVIDRDTASRLGLTALDIDNALYDAFGQRQVSTTYSTLNQYHVVEEMAQEFQQDPDALNNIYIRHSTTGIPTINNTAGVTSNSNVLSSGTNSAATVAASAQTGTASTTQVRLSTIAHFAPQRSALAVNHQSGFPAITLSFNLAPDSALSDATNAIANAQREMGMPGNIHTGFAGTAQIFQATLASEPKLILLALVTVYIVLGMLYESFIHPLTILSTLPSAGVGAILALLLFKIDLTVIAMIGIILLIGIVKKNAIMMIDFALLIEREQGRPPEQAIYEACLLRFRPIMMTTMAALLGGLPLALGTGTGAELRKPLGVTIVGGLVVSQMLTLFTTPVVYLYFDRWRAFMERWRTKFVNVRVVQQAAGD